MPGNKPRVVADWKALGPSAGVLIRRQWDYPAISILLNADVMVFMRFLMSPDLLAAQRLNVGLVRATLLYGAARHEGRVLGYLCSGW